MSNEDIQHLNLLSTLHYMAGAIAALVSCIPLIHLVWGWGSPMPSEWGWIVLLMEAVFILLGFNMAICVMVAGWKLKRRTNRMFCMAVAGMECIFLPFGILLGGVTLVALNKASIKALFAHMEAGF